MMASAAHRVKEDDPIVAGEGAVDDAAGILLWASPTAGAPISLAWMPAGAQCFVHLRPAQLVSHPEGEKVIESLGPWGRKTVDRLRTLIGAELAELDAVTFAVVVVEGGKLTVCIRVELVEPWDENELAGRLPDGRSVGRGELHRLVDDWSYLMPKASLGRTLVVCPAELANELVESAGEAPQLVRDIEGLLAQSDADRTATIILAPRFLDAGGSGLLSDAAEPLREVLRWLVDADATAVAVSADLRENLYVELHAAPALNVRPRQLAASLRERVDDAPDAIESIVTGRAWPPYGRSVLSKLPAMLRTMATYTRTGAERNHAVLNCHLPSVAAHNLLMGAELLLTQSDGAAAAPREPAGGEESVAERLARPTSLSFAKDTLQRAIDMLVGDLGVEIAIEGRELQGEGITRNQSFGIDLRDRPAREILVEILRRANPDRSAASPADPRQKLVFVIDPGGGGAAGRIIVTTRAAAEKRGLVLPAEFVGTGR
jgi:hypothetical protein